MEASRRLVGVHETMVGWAWVDVWRVVWSDWEDQHPSACGWEQISGDGRGWREGQYPLGCIQRQVDFPVVKCGWCGVRGDPRGAQTQSTSAGWGMVEGGGERRMSYQGG